MTTGNKVLGTGMYAFLILWVLAGLAAYIMSLYCWWKYPGCDSSDPSGASDANLIGFLLAMILGPFYWIFYFYKSGYCGRK